MEAKAVERAKYEGLDKHERLTTVGDHFYGKLKEFALFKMSYYMCFKCKSPYFGGMKDCGDGDQQLEEFRKEDLVCAKCSSGVVGAGQKHCDKHGSDYIDFKCRYCCSIALWFCHGDTHYCEPCHNKNVYGASYKKDCMGKDCPLGIEDHPRAGTEFALGCGLCRSKRYQEF